MRHEETGMVFQSFALIPQLTVWENRHLASILRHQEALVRNKPPFEVSG